MPTPATPAAPAHAPSERRTRRLGPVTAILVLVFAVGALLLGSRRPAAEDLIEGIPMHTLTLSAGTLGYDDRGAGPLVVMAPGLGDLRQQYRFLVPQLVDAGYRVVTVDLRGHGDASTGWPDYTSAATGRDLLALVEHLDAGPGVLIGNSFAGASVVHAAADRPDLVSGVVMIGPFVRAAEMGAFMQTAMRALFMGPWKVRAWDMYYASLYKSRKPDDLATYRATLRRNLSEPGRFDALRAMMFRDEVDAAERFPELVARDVPALVVMGTADSDFPDPAAEARWIAEQLRGEVHFVEGAGHYPHAELPDATAPAIREFLDRVTRGA